MRYLLRQPYGVAAGPYIQTSSYLLLRAVLREVLALVRGGSLYLFMISSEQPESSSCSSIHDCAQLLRISSY